LRVTQLQQLRLVAKRYHEKVDVIFIGNFNSGVDSNRFDNVRNGVAVGDHQRIARELM